MPSFGTKSTKRLEQCDQRIQLLFREVVKRFDCTVLVGHRSEMEQNIAFHSGKSKLAWPKSKHNSYPSRAIDIAPYPIPEEFGAKDRDEYEKFKYFAFYVLGMAAAFNIPLRWGGDWDCDFDTTDQDFNDLLHFELND